MSDSTGAMPADVRVDWYVVPWGPLPNKENTLRYSVRAMLQLRASDEKGSATLDDLDNWPAYVARIKQFDVHIEPAESSRKPVCADIAKRYCEYLKQHNLTVEQATQLWSAALGDLIEQILAAAKNRATIYCGAPPRTTVPKRLHCTASVARMSDAHLADVFANSLVRVKPARDGIRTAAAHGQVAAAAPGPASIDMLRASASMYAFPNLQEPAVRLGQKRLGAETESEWARSVLTSLGQARSHLETADRDKSGRPSTSQDEPIHLPYSAAYLKYLLYLLDGGQPQAAKSEANPDGSILGEFEQRLVERRLAYASAPSGRQTTEQATHGPEGCSTSTELQSVMDELHRRIAAIVLHPWLAKVLGLTIDMAVTLDGKVSDLNWIAVAQVTDGLGRSHTTDPMMRTKLKDGFPAIQNTAKAASYRSGVLNVSSRDGAFMLTQIDVDRAPEQYVQTALSFATQLAAGQVANKIALAFQPQATVGLSLIEVEGTRKLNMMTARKFKKQDTVQDVYLEQLLLGYRPDLQTSGPLVDGNPVRQPWQALSARRIRRVRMGPKNTDITAWFTNIGRCEAFLPERTRTTPTDGKGNQNALIEGELFRWGTAGLGAGPAVSPVQQTSRDITVTQQDKHCGPSGLAIEYDNADVPPQRFGQRYRVGVRLAMIDGNSLCINEAAAVYDRVQTDGPKTIGDDTYPASSGGTTHSRFSGASLRRFEAVAPPTVLMIDHPVRERFPKDAAKHVVVASSSKGVARAWRALVPPRSTSQELCLRHGAFDDFSSAHTWPPSAFKDAALTRQGSFPIELASAGDALPGKMATRELYFRKPATPLPAPRIPFYPDPWARRAVLGFFRAGDDRLMQVEWLDYYEGAREWPDCRDWRLCVEAVSSLRDPHLGFEVIKADGVVTVRLLPAVHIVLKVWHEIDAEKLGQSAVVEQMAQLTLDPDNGGDLRNLIGIPRGASYDIVEIRQKLVDTMVRWEKHSDWQGNPPPPFGTVDEMVNVTSFWMINPLVEIDLLHVVEQPLWPPAAVHAPAPTDEFPFEICRQAGETKASFRGELTLDRPSTARVDGAAHWTDNPQRASTVGTDGGYAAVPKVSNAHLFALKDVAVIAKDVSGSPPLSPMPADLTSVQKLQRLDTCITIRKDDRSKTAPVVEDYDFMDTRARAVDVQFTGISRYSDEFANLTPAQASRASERKRMIVHGTKRPDPVDVEYVVPVLKWADATISVPDRIGRRREAGWLRIWLGPTWYSSGNGELLALICWPSSLGDQQPRGLRGLMRRGADALYVAPDPSIERYVTRWGLDALVEEQISFGNMPIDALRNRLHNLSDVHASGGPAELADVDAYHLRDMPMFEPAYDLANLPEFGKVPFVAKGRSAASPSEVKLALFRPRLDTRTGRMFVDIQLDPSTAYQPFVRLALARYQVHAVDEAHKLSPITSTEFVQLLPERTASLTVVRSGGGDIKGVRFAIAGTSLPNAPSRSCRSRFVATVEQRQLSFLSADERNEINGAWLPANDSPESTELVYRPNDHIWSAELALHTRVAHEYSIRIDEYEMLSIDIDEASGRAVYFDRLMIRDL